MRRALVVAGVLVAGYAVIGAVFDDDVRLIGVLLFLAGCVVAHDGVLMPLMLGAGALIGRFVPAPARPVVTVAAVCSVAVTLVAVPLMLGVGDLPYGQGLVVVLALVWAGALVRMALVWTALVRIRKARAVPVPPVDG